MISPSFCSKQLNKEFQTLATGRAGAWLSVGDTGTFPPSNESGRGCGGKHLFTLPLPPPPSFLRTKQKNRISLCSLGWPGTCYVDQAVLISRICFPLLPRCHTPQSMPFEGTLPLAPFVVSSHSELSHANHPDTLFAQIRQVSTEAHVHPAPLASVKPPWL